MIISTGKQKYTTEQVLQLDNSYVVTLPLFEQHALLFLQSWLKGDDTFLQFTSGSTGEPKPVQISRQQMLDSARLTIQHLHLNEIGSCLLAISAEHIGGKMLLVRALECNMNVHITEPSSHVFSALDKNHYYSLASVVPLQLQELLSDELAVQNAERFSHILIGGAAVSGLLEQKLKQLKGVKLWHTYGMTETVSHVALRCINAQQSSDYYTAFSGVELDVDSRGCLKIKAAVTGHEWLQTNDVAMLQSANTFSIIGRLDEIINSGGIKIDTRLLETKIATILEEKGITYHFFVGAIPDERLGQKVVLVMEVSFMAKAEADEILQVLKHQLPRFWAPANLFFMERFLLTSSGKLNKMSMLKLFAHS